MTYDGPEWLNITYKQSLRYVRRPWTAAHRNHVRRYMLGEITAETAAAYCRCGAEQIRGRAALAMRLAIDATSRAR